MSKAKKTSSAEECAAGKIRCQRYFGLTLALAPALSQIALSSWVWLRYRDAYLEFGKEFPGHWNLMDIILGDMLDIDEIIYLLILIFISAIGLALFIKPTRMRFVGSIYMALLLAVIIIFNCLVISSDIFAPDFS